MALEEKIDALTAELKKLNARLEAGGSVGAAAPAEKTPAPAKTPAATTEKAPAKTPAKTPAAPKITPEEIKAAAMEVKNQFGGDEAAALIKAHADGGKLADLMNLPANFVAFMAACKAKMAETGDDAEEADDEL